MLWTYSDSDHGGDHETRRSWTGTILFLNGGPVVWSSSRQPIVTLSSAEAEFVAATAAVTSIKWLTMLLQEIGVEIEGTELLMDNQPAIKIIRNPEFHMRTKHIDIRYKFIRERYQEGLFDLFHVPSADQLADIFTKALAAPAFRKNASEILSVIE